MPPGVMNSRGPPDGLQRVWGSNKFASRYWYRARAHGWKGTSLSLGFPGNGGPENAPRPWPSLISGSVSGSASIGRPFGTQMPFSPAGMPSLTRPSGQRGVGFDGGAGGRRF